MNKSVIISHSGKQHSYHVARALFDGGYLEKFYTSSYVTSSFVQNFVNETGNQYWSRRFVEGLPGRKVESNWRFELKEMFFSKLYGQSEKTLHSVFQRDINFDRFMASRMKHLKGDLFWGYQGSSHESLMAARNAGKIAICEMAAAHAPAAVRILTEEQKLHPEWADSFDFLNFPQHYFERLIDEPHQADVVIGASAFTLDTLRHEGVEEKKLRYLPLGFELDKIPYSEKIHQQGPLRLLYAGRVTQRKGIKYLLEAMKSFSKEDVELDIIGNVHGSGIGLRGYSRFHFNHSISQYDLFRKYNSYDAFVLPSVFEGFGLVIVEAMAAGLPVITTPNTIGPELIRDDVNGYIVPIRNIQEIVAAITKLLKKSPDELVQMRQAARESALNFSWLAYGKRMKYFLENALGEQLLTFSSINCAHLKL